MLQTSASIMERQHTANLEAQRKYEEAKFHNLTVRGAFMDMGSALSGISEDLFGNTAPKPLWDIVTSENRLRGLGMLMMLTASVLIFIYTV